MAEDTFDEAATQWADAQRRYAKLVARYWADDGFRAEVQRDPAASLRRAGIEVPDGRRVKTVEVAEDEMLLLIPASQRRWEEAVAAPYHTMGTRGTIGTAGSLATVGPSCVGSVFTLATIFTFGCATKGPEAEAPEEPPKPMPREPGGSSESDTGLR